MKPFLDFIQWSFVVMVYTLMVCYATNFIVKSYNECADVHDYVQASIVNFIIIFLLAITWSIINAMAKENK